MPPFTTLHVCMGNICRSPMSERLLAAALHKQLGDAVVSRYLNHGAGTGSWHIGEPMQSGAARQITARGGDPSGFRARRISGDLVDMSDLVLTATAEQVAYVLDLRPDAAGRTFALREFGRLLPLADLSGLPPAGDADPPAYARGTALVAAVDAVRSDGHGGRQPARPADDLDDPYGLPDREFARVADTVETVVYPLAQALIG
jgi:protein-tyrosine phosphatase